jgi:DNA polymerase-3 subunit epsilon
MALFRRTRSVEVQALPDPLQCDFVAIDFETANEKRGSACAVGIAVVREGDVAEGVSTLIDPQLDFNPYCTAVSGIDARAVEDAPTFPIIWPALCALLEGQTVVAHNASFDMSVLRNTAARYGLRGGPNFDIYCTYRLSKRVWREFPSYSLNYVAASQGVTFHHHQAGEDATACALVALAVCREVGVRGLSDLPATLSMLPGRIRGPSYDPISFHDEARSLVAAPGCEDADPTHPLYGKSICFTGAMLSMPRREAMARITEVGCDFKNSVGKTLSYLVVGDGDFVSFQDGWRTGKLTRVMELRNEGALIEVIPEQDFLHLLMS